MSAKDIKHETDQEFEDFLLGQGDLASLLQNLPQPAPSAELDARILRDAEIALANTAGATPSADDSAPSSQKNSSAPATHASAVSGAILSKANNVANAANDPAAQPGLRPPASFFSHWRYPLGLAATLVFTMSVTLSVWRGQSLQETPPVLIAGDNGPDTPAAAASAAVPPASAGLPAPATSAKDGAAKEEAVKGAAIRADAKTGAAAPSPAAPVELAKAQDAKRDATTEPARPADELAQQPLKKAKRMAMDSSPVLAEAASQEKAQAPASSQIQAQGQVLASAQENKQMAREDESVNRQANEALAQSRMQQARHNHAQQMQDKSQNRAQEQAQNRAQEQTLNRGQNQALESRAMAARARARVEAEAEADMADSAPAQVAAAPARTYASPPPPAVEARPVPEARPAPANVQAGIDPNRVSRAEASPVHITGALHAPAKPAAPKEAPQAWFERIEKLLKDGKRKEALDEWQKFQVTHPAFVVPAATLKELEALRGQK